MSDEVQWIRSGRARSLLHSAGVNYPDYDLQQALRIGKVPARAAQAVITEWRKPSRTFADYDVPARLWADGDLSLEHDHYLKTGCALRGLSFDRAAMVAWFEIEDHPPAAAPVKELAGTTAKGKGGRKPARGWPVFAAALAEWVLTSGDDEAAFVEKGPDTILGEVLKIAQARTDEELPRTTYQPAVQEFVDLMTQATRRK